MSMRQRECTAIRFTTTRSGTQTPGVSGARLANGAARGKLSTERHARTVTVRFPRKLFELSMVYGMPTTVTMYGRGYLLYRGCCVTAKTESCFRLWFVRSLTGGEPVNLEFSRVLRYLILLNYWFYFVLLITFPCFRLYGEKKSSCYSENKERTRDTEIDMFPVRRSITKTRPVSFYGERCVVRYIRILRINKVPSR